MYNEYNSMCPDNLPPNAMIEDESYGVDGMPLTDYLNIRGSCKIGDK